MVAWEDLFKAAPSDVAESAGISLLDSVHGLVGIVSTVDVLAMNRVLGLGVRRDAEPDAPIALVQEYEKRGVTRFFVPLSPIAQPTTLAKTLERFGLKPYNAWMRLARPTSNLPTAATSLQARTIGAEDAHLFGRLVCRNFGWPASLEGWFAATVGRPNWTHYMAFDGKRPAATAAMYKRGHCAWMGFATTDEVHRGKGAQSKLIEMRIRDAAETGCDLVTMETAQPTLGKPAPSYSNALRLGFEALYARPNYIWMRTPSAG